MRRPGHKCAIPAAPELSSFPDMPTQLFVYSKSRRSIPARCGGKNIEIIVDGASRQPAAHLVLRMQEPGRNNYGGLNLNSSDCRYCGPDTEQNLLAKRTR